MSKKQPISLTRINRVIPKSQVQNEKGEVQEELAYPSFEIDEELFRRFKVSLAYKDVEMREFLISCIDRAVNNEIKLPIPIEKLDRSREIKKKSFNLQKSKLIAVKGWLGKNKLKLRDLLTYCIDEFVEKEETKRKN